MSDQPNNQDPNVASENQTSPAMSKSLQKKVAFKKGERIVLSVPPNQAIRLTVMDVSPSINNLTEKEDIAYTFSDGSMIFQSTLESEGYDWRYELSLEAEEV